MPATLALGAPRLRLRPVALDEAIVVADPRCPVCAGAWLWSLFFSHTLTCALRDADDATVAADAERAAGLDWRDVFTRPSTVAERALAGAFATPAAGVLPASVTTVTTRLAVQTRRVTIAGLELDRVCTPAEYAAAAAA